MDNTDSFSDTSPQGGFLPDLCQVRAVLFLVLVAELLAIVLSLADNGFGQFSWQAFSLTSFFLQWAVLLNAGVLCWLRTRLNRCSWPIAATVSYLVIISVVVFLSVMAQWLMAGGFGGAEQWQVDVNVLLTHSVIAAVLAGIALRYFYLTQQLRRQEQAELLARIQALQSRIRPHFLFNSMNIIASLIAVDQDAAERAVEDLSALFRASLSEVATEVSLAEELELCRHYASIEQLRLGDRLRVEWHFDGLPDTVKVPSLSLQPLLENAIYHGIQQLPEGGKVVLAGHYQQGILSLSVTNPMPQQQQMKVLGNQIAQNNIHHRLQALYGSQASLRINITEQEHQAVMQYPITLDDSDKDSVNG